MIFEIKKNVLNKLYLIRNIWQCWSIALRMKCSKPKFLKKLYKTPHYDIKHILMCNIFSCMLMLKFLRIIDSIKFKNGFFRSW